MRDFLVNFWTGAIIVIVVGSALAILPASTLIIIAGCALGMGVVYAIVHLRRTLGTLALHPKVDDRG